MRVRFFPALVGCGPSVRRSRLRPDRDEHAHALEDIHAHAVEDIHAHAHADIHADADADVEPGRRPLARQDRRRPIPARVGQDLTYTLTIHNSGPNIALYVVLTDTLPAGVEFVSASFSAPPRQLFRGAAELFCFLSASPQQLQRPGRHRGQADGRRIRDQFGEGATATDSIRTSPTTRRPSRPTSGSRRSRSSCTATAILSSSLSTASLRRRRLRNSGTRPRSSRACAIPGSRSAPGRLPPRSSPGPSSASKTSTAGSACATATTRGRSSTCAPRSGRTASSWWVRARHPASRGSSGIRPSRRKPPCRLTSLRPWTSTGSRTSCP